MSCRDKPRTPKLPTKSNTKRSEYLCTPLHVSRHLCDWCCSNGSGDYNAEIHFAEVPKKRNTHLPCYGRPGSVGPLGIDLISLFLWLHISADTARAMLVRAWQNLHSEQQPRQGAQLQEAAGLGCSGSPTTCQKRAALSPRANIAILTNG